MTASGTYTFNPELAEHIDEAFERCGIDPADLTSRHLRSAIRSSNLVLSDWQNFGYKQFTLAFLSHTLIANDATFLLPVGGVDIFHATLKRDSRETEMYSISRSDYNALHDKTSPGRPDRYFVDRSTFIGDAPASTVHLWHVPDTGSDTMEIWYILSHQNAGNMQNTLGISPGYQEAFACGLAFHLSRKYAPDRRAALREDYLGANYNEFSHSVPGGAMGRALTEDRDRSPAVFRVEYGRRGRR
jgi:hypothetical protein